MATTAAALIAVLTLLTAVIGFSTNIAVSLRTRREAIEKLTQTSHALVEIHQMVNDRLDAALRRINELESHLVAANAASVKLVDPSQADLAYALAQAHAASLPTPGPIIPPILNPAQSPTTPTDAEKALDARP